MFLLSLLAVIVVFSIGAGVAKVISMIPLSVLERAADGGRYSRLGAPEPPPPVKPVGRRARPLQLSGGKGLWLPGVHAG